MRFYFFFLPSRLGMLLHCYIFQTSMKTCTPTVQSTWEYAFCKHNLCEEFNQNSVEAQSVAGTFQSWLLKISVQFVNIYKTEGSLLPMIISLQLPLEHAGNFMPPFTMLTPFSTIQHLMRECHVISPTLSFCLILEPVLALPDNH